MGGRGKRTQGPISLQDRQRRREGKAKAEPSWRFWGLEVQGGNRETLRAADPLAQAHNGAPGIDGVTCEDIEASGGEAVLEHLRDERVARPYQPLRVRRKELPKAGGTKVRVLGMPTIRDRVVPGALKLILEPIVEADLPPGS